MSVHACITHALEGPRLDIAVCEVQKQLLSGWGRLKQMIVARIGDLLRSNSRMFAKFVFSNFQSGYGPRPQVEVGVWIKRPDGSRTLSGACIVRVYNLQNGEWAYQMNGGPIVKPELIAATVANRLRVL